METTASELVANSVNALDAPSEDNSITAAEGESTESSLPATTSSISIPLTRSMAQPTETEDDEFDDDEDDDDEQNIEDYPLPVLLTPGGRNRQAGSKQLQHSPPMSVGDLSSRLALSVPFLSPKKSSNRSLLGQVATATTEENAIELSIDSLTSNLVSSNASSGSEPSMQRRDDTVHDDSVDVYNDACLSPPILPNNGSTAGTTIATIIASKATEDNQSNETMGQHLPVPFSQEKPVLTSASSPSLIPQQQQQQQQEVLPGHENASAFLNRFTTRPNPLLTTAPSSGNSANRTLNLDTVSTTTIATSTSTSSSLWNKMIELPRIVVMGDTSCGKSSLLGQLWGVELPAASTLSTRCPIRLHLQRHNGNKDNSNRSHRTATVSIEWNQPRVSAAAAVAHKSRYPNYTPVTITADDNGDNNAKLHDDENNGNTTAAVRHANANAIQDWRHRVSTAIALAQEFILKQQQPSPQPHYVPNNTSAVSHHVVVVHIQAPEYMVHEMTIVDLPGIVRSKAGRNESATLAAELAALQAEYLSHERSIIVAVHAANIDWHNAQITADALCVDATTQRTVPVLTKPDLIDVGAEPDVVQVLQGEHLAFHHGWHMVKCRGQAALDARQSIDDAIVDEAHFFATVEPWKSMSTNDTEREQMFGTIALRQKLGRLLVQMIQSTLPTIMSEIRQRQQDAAAKLDAMGTDGMLLSASDRRRYFQTTSQRIVAQISASLTGKHHGGSTACGSGNHGGGAKLPAAKYRPHTPPFSLQSGSGMRPLEQANMGAANLSVAAPRLHECCEHFRDRILEGSLATIRKVVEGSSVLVSTPRKGTIRGVIVHIDNDDSLACVDFVNAADRHSDVLFEATGVEAKSSQAIGEDDIWSEHGKILVGRANQEYDVFSPIPLDRIRTDPTWLKDKMAQHRTDDLPCFLNIDVFKNVVDDFISADWQPHALRLLDQTRDAMHTAIDNAVVSVKSNSSSNTSRVADETQWSSLALSKERYPLLATLIQQQCRAAAKILVQDAHRQILAHFEVERHPYTQNKDLFEMIAQSKHASLRRDLEVALKVDSQGVVYDTQAIKAIMDSVFERHEQYSMADQMAHEMELVLDAYGSVAAQRVVDRTPMICWQVFRLLPPAILEALANVTDDVLERCLQENPQFRSEYQAAADELAAMNAALEHFESLV